MLSPGEALPPALLEAEVLEADGARRSLGALLQGRPTLLMLLRHYGCTGCSQQVDALIPFVPRLAALGLHIVLCGNGEPVHLRDFAERQRLDGYPIVLCTDPTRAVYKAVGLHRSVWSTIGPGALAREVVARTRGYRSTRLEGDVWQQGGALLCTADARVAGVYRAWVAAEPIDARELVAAAVALLAHEAAAAERTIA